ncbi:MAG: NifB/NifX family molybdenum-iron cluster-binding protein [Candidatus Heimdallarchaeaceae archaeon]
MKYAVPIMEKNGWESNISAHFGRCPFYAIWDEETNELEIIENNSSHFGGVGMPAEFLANHCNAIICSGIGSKAIQLSEQLGVAVYVGAEGTVRQTIENFKNGVLKQATSNDGCHH